MASSPRRSRRSEVAAGGLTPDLRGSSAVSSLERFAGVVRDGARSDDGIPAYVDLTYDELVAPQHQVRWESERELAARAERGGR